jgi:hypothetical protein
MSVTHFCPETFFEFWRETRPFWKLSALSALASTTSYDFLVVGDPVRVHFFRDRAFGERPIHVLAPALSFYGSRRLT